MNYVVFLYQLCVLVLLEKGDGVTSQTSYTIRFDKSLTYPDGGFIAVDPGDSKPGRQVQHVLQYLFIKLEVGQLPLPLQRTDIDLVRGQILGEPKEMRPDKKSEHWGKRLTSSHITDDLGDRITQNSIIHLGQDVFEVMQLNESS